MRLAPSGLITTFTATLTTAFIASVMTASLLMPLGSFATGTLYPGANRISSLFVDSLIPLLCSVFVG